MKPRLLMFPGWAYAPESLDPLAAKLSVHFDTSYETHGDQSSWLLGWSLGGLQSLKLASEQPSRVSGLILIASTARFCTTLDYDTGQPMAAVRAMAQNLATRPNDVLRDFYRRAAQPNPCIGPDLNQRVEAGLQIGEEKLKQGLQFLQKLDMRKAAAALQIPCLILHGRNDLIIPIAAARELARVVPGATLIPHEQEGHELPLREPGWVADQILQFVTAPR